MASKEIPPSQDVRQKSKSRLWTDDEMMELLDLIQRGYTYRDVTDGKTVPISTLWSRVKGMYEGQVRPKIGSPGIFPVELEADFALYLKHCDLLRIPKTQLEFKQDIQHYVKYHDLTFKLLTQDGPGRTWTDRFAEEWKELVLFQSKGAIFRIKNDPISMKMWVHERDAYTKIQKESKAFPSREFIMVVETSQLEVNVDNKIAIHILMIYDAQGNILNPFAAHSGQIPKAVTSYFEKDLAFCQTGNGEIDQNILMELCHYIESYLSENQLFQSPVIYMCPGVSSEVGFTLWNQCNMYNFVLQTVPQNIYNYFRTGNMGIFEKMKPSFKQIVDKKHPHGKGHCMFFDFFEMFRTVLANAKWASHLRNSCRRLRIVAIESAHHDIEDPKDEQHEENILDASIAEPEPVQEEVVQDSAIQEIIRNSQRANIDMENDSLPDLE